MHRVKFKCALCKGIDIARTKALIKWITGQIKALRVPLRLRRHPGFHLCVTGELLNLSSCIRSLRWSVTLCLPGWSLISACSERAGGGTVHLPRLQRRGKRDSRDQRQDQRSVCCWRLSICPAGAVCLSRASRCLTGSHAARFRSTSPFHPSYIIRRSDKWKTIIECRLVTAITARDARIRQFPRLLLGDPFSELQQMRPNIQSDVDHFASWHNEAACGKSDAFAPQNSGQTHVKWAHVSSSSGLHLRSFCIIPNLIPTIPSFIAPADVLWGDGGHGCSSAEPGTYFCFGAMPPPGLASLWHHTAAAATFCFNYQEETWVTWPEPWRRLPAALPHPWIMVDEWLIWIKCV